jgi:hypothetical protein
MVAAAIHGTWRNFVHARGWPIRPDFDRPYAELAPSAKEDNLAAARRVPEILQVARLHWRRAIDGWPPALPENELRKRLDEHLELMAEAEHKGWVEHRKDNGWAFAATRDDARKLHPAMLPYMNLPEHERDKNRNAVSHIPDIAARAGYRIILIE